MIKTLIDTRWLTAKPTGVGVYIRELLQEFAIQAVDQEITLLGGHGMEKFENFKRIPLSPVGKKVYQGLWKTIKWPLLNSLAGKQDVVHFTNGTAIPHHYPKNILTIHDLAFVEYPEMIESKNLKFLQKFVPWSVAQATHIIAVSQETKKDLQRHFQVPAEKITVIYNGIDREFLKTPTVEQLAKVRVHYELPAKFFLSVSTIEPRKDFATMIEAYALLPASIRKEYELVIVGSRGWEGEYQKLQAVVKKLQLSNKVHFLGYVDLVDLPIIYRLASLYLHTSLKEGFGIGLVQAMACGLPIIASNISCHPEIVQDAGLYFIVKNPQNLAEKIVQMLENESLRHDCIAKGLKLSENYSWKLAAQKTLKLYET